MDNSPHYEQIRKKLCAALARVKELRTESTRMFNDLRSIDGNFVGLLTSEEVMVESFHSVEDFIIDEIKSLDLSAGISLFD